MQNYCDPSTKRDEQYMQVKFCTVSIHTSLEWRGRGFTPLRKRCSVYRQAGAAGGRLPASVPRSRGETLFRISQLFGPIARLTSSCPRSPPARSPVPAQPQPTPCALVRDTEPRPPAAGNGGLSAPGAARAIFAQDGSSHMVSAPSSGSAPRPRQTGAGAEPRRVPPARPAEHTIPGGLGARPAARRAPLGPGGGQQNLPRGLGQRQAPGDRRPPPSGPAASPPRASQTMEPAPRA